MKQRGRDGGKLKAYGQLIERERYSAEHEMLKSSRSDVTWQQSVTMMQFGCMTCFSVTEPLNLFSDFLIQQNAEKS